MTHAENALHFASLHKPGQPLVLFNVWDAGSAKAVADEGAPAIATSSWAVAQSQGYDDGQQIPFDRLLGIVERVIGVVRVPVSVDFEGGYASDEAGLRKNVDRLIDAGVSGINFEDGVIGASGLHSAEDHARRIAIIRSTADKRGIPLFINARTDVFFGSDTNHAGLFDQAVQRAESYREAGASGLFVPGLVDDALIERLCTRVTLPVNVLMAEGLSPLKRLAELGVSRLSYGARPYRNAMRDLGVQAAALFRK
jgi:2-methylisocitrate lyase-like PEP mutase family enzyme